MADAEYKRLGCKAEGCDKDSHGLGLCATHYRRLKRHGSHDPANKICANCGVGFATVMHNAMYCSKVCKVQAWRASNPEKTLEAAKRSAEVQAKRKQAPPPCSRIYAGHCKQCSEPFVLRSAAHGFCSQECKAACAARDAYERSLAQHKKQAAEIRCDECGCLFCPLYGASHARLCDCCAGVRKTERKRMHRLARKMRQRTQTVEAVNPIKVFERDGWRCQLCKRPTPRKLRGSLDDRAPELDHILPVSVGGEHSYRNTQCACRACNAAKSNKPMGQMLLIG